MKTEAEIRAWLAKTPERAPGDMADTFQITFETASWLVRIAIRKVILGEIPANVHAYHCGMHDQPYLAKEGHNYGCAHCPTHDIWELVKDSSNDQL